MTIEADPRHVKILVDSTGVRDERPLTTKASKDDREKEAGRDLAKEEKLDDNSVSKYRSDVARLNYLAAATLISVLEVSVFEKRTGVLFIHCGTTSCRSLQCRSAHNVCTFTGLPHRHWRDSRQNNQPLLAARMPRRIAVFVAGLRHSVMNIAVSRLSSLVSSCSGSASGLFLYAGGTQRIPQALSENGCHTQHVHTLFENVAFQDKCVAR